MQQIHRLRQSRSRILFNDTLATLKQERRESVSKMKELTNEVIVTKPSIVDLSVFDKYVLYVKEHTTELSCHHRRFYWHRCDGCRRGREQADAYREYYQKRIHKVLSAIQTK